MISIINRLFKKKNNLNFVKSKLQILDNTTNVSLIFDLINNFSKDSEVRFVGGCLRKILSGEEIDDIDLATNLEPVQVCEILSKNKIQFYESGIEHGTVTAKIKNTKFEITTLRKDLITDGRHAKVGFSKNWHEDASRRDFTINSIYSDLNGNLFDPFDGTNDLKNGKLVFVGDADKRIKEDYLRILRYIRFFAKYSKSNHNKNITKSINKNLSGISKISSDRLLDEFKKIFKSKNLGKICNDVFSYEIITLIFPQFKGLTYLKNLKNSSYEKLNELDFVFLLSLLIIDETDNAEYFIYKFNISNKAKKRIFNLKDFYFNKNIKNKINTKNLWKIFYKHGKETLNDILNYKIYTSRKIDNSINKYIDYFKDKKVPLFPIKGEDLMKKFNIPEGKKIGYNLKLIENHWLENEFKITEDQIKKIIKN